MAQAQNDSNWQLLNNLEQKRAISNKKYAYLGSAKWKQLEFLLI